MIIIKNKILSLIINKLVILLYPKSVEMKALHLLKLKWLSEKLKQPKNSFTLSLKEIMAQLLKKYFKVEVQSGQNNHKEVNKLILNGNKVFSVMIFL